MAMTVAVKEAMVDALAITITFPHCNIGITEISSNSRTTIFLCRSLPFESQMSLQNIHLNLYTGKTGCGKVTPNWCHKRNSSID